MLAGCDAFEHFPPPVLRPLPRLVRLPGLTRLALRALAGPALLADAVADAVLAVLAQSGLTHPGARDRR